MIFEFEALLKILIAVACGGIIGYEREYKNRPAGLRTHILVCVGAALVMIVAHYIYGLYPEGVVEPSRMGASVVSGIGFLGAGTIIRERFSVKGLTTAATLWVVACIGLAVGGGYYLMALIVTAAIFIILIVFRSLERVLKIKPSKAKLKITADFSTGLVNEIKATLSEAGLSARETKFIKRNDGKTVDFIFDIACPSKNDWNIVLETLYDNEGIKKADIEY
jgi:putative Mg2+ transporter-C (MgtC) family protein